MTLKRKIINTIKVSMVLAILGVGFYPTVSDAWNRYVASKLTVEYNDTVQKADTSKIDEAWKTAQEYNEKLASSGANHVAEYTERLKSLAGSTSGEDAKDAEYESLLNLDGNGVMGFVSIPKIDVTLPIGHYTTDEVLSEGTGHLYGSSLPVGGESTHSVITAHRGLPSAMLFTDLDKLETGDTFSISVLGKTLNYSITDIRTVLPSEMESLAIESGKDLVTLLTCTPYGVNTHRLLVTGERMKDEITKTEETPKITQAFHTPYFIFGAVIAVIVAAIIALILIWTRKEKK